MGVGGGTIGAAMTRLNGRGMTAGGLSGTAGPSVHEATQTTLRSNVNDVH